MLHLEDEDRAVPRRGSEHAKADLLVCRVLLGRWRKLQQCDTIIELALHRHVELVCELRPVDWHARSATHSGLLWLAEWCCLLLGLLAKGTECGSCLLRLWLAES